MDGVTLINAFQNDGLVRPVFFFFVLFACECTYSYMSRGQINSYFIHTFSGFYQLKGYVYNKFCALSDNCDGTVKF